MWNYDLTRKCLIAEAWCPVSSYEETQSAVRRGAARSGAQVPSIVNVIETDEKPPTYFRQNKFTAGFQGIVDGFGVTRCGEIYPRPFTIITYPFLFGVMFGDVGPGFLVLLVAEPAVAAATGAADAAAPNTPLPEAALDAEPARPAARERPRRPAREVARGSGSLTTVRVRGTSLRSVTLTTRRATTAFRAAGRSGRASASSSRARVPSSSRPWPTP